MLTHNKKDRQQVFRTPPHSSVDIIQQLDDISKQLTLLAQSVSIYSKQLQHHMEKNAVDSMMEG